MSVHNIGAAILKTEELSLEESEAKTLAQNIANVAQHYDAVPGMSEKTAAWTTLGMSLGMIYGPRVMAYRFRTMAEKGPQGQMVMQ